MWVGIYIHIGADEVTPERWRACPLCKPLMDKPVHLLIIALAWLGAATRGALTIHACPATFAV